MRSDSENNKSQLNNPFNGKENENRDSIKKNNKLNKSHRKDRKKDPPFNFMHNESCGIKLVPRQMRELHDARSIAIMCTTMSHYCKKFCEQES